MRHLMRLVLPALGAFVLLFPQAADASVRILVDRSSQRMTVLVDGAVQHVWPVSTGVSGHATPTGSFRPFRLEREHFSREWDDAPMPHSIFFTSAGHAIHGTNVTRRLGSAASHGCIRLSPGNAARLFTLVGAEGLGNTRVVITDEHRARSRQPGSDRRSWSGRGRDPGYWEPDYDRGAQESYGYSLE